MIILFQNHQRLISRLTLLLLIVFIPDPTFAFKPDKTGHIVITKVSLKKVVVISPTGKQKWNFSEKATDEIVESNVNVDQSEFFDASAHCDDETLDTCSERVLEKRKIVIAN